MFRNSTQINITVISNINQINQNTQKEYIEAKLYHCGVNSQMPCACVNPMCISWSLSQSHTNIVEKYSGAKSRVFKMTANKQVNK